MDLLKLKQEAILKLSKAQDESSLKELKGFYVSKTKDFDYKNMTDDELKEMINRADLDHDSEVNFEEFYTIIATLNSLYDIEIMALNMLCTNTIQGSNDFFWTTFILVSVSMYSYVMVRGIARLYFHAFCNQNLKVFQTISQFPW